MSDEDKTAVAVKSIQEFQAMLDGIYQQGWDAGFEAGVARANHVPVLE